MPRWQAGSLGRESPAGRRRPRAGRPFHPDLPFALIMQPFLLADDLHFRLEPDAARGERALLYFVDQREHVVRGRAAVVDDKVAVNLRHLRAADARAFEPELIDEFSRRAHLRIFENAARARFARLRRAPLLR